MKYRLTTIERDAAGIVHRLQYNLHYASLSGLVRRARGLGLVPGAQSRTGLTIIAVEFTSEETS